jgi:hypothetical protein
MQYQSHGDYHLILNQYIIEVTLVGAFNDLGVKAWTEAVKNTIKLFDGKPFAILMDLTQAQGATPEAFEVANQYNEWLNTQNMIAKAVVFGNRILQEIEQVMVKAKQKQKIKNFFDVNEARLWLQQQFIK